MNITSIYMCSDLTELSNVHLWYNDTYIYVLNVPSIITSIDTKQSLYRLQTDVHSDVSVHTFQSMFYVSFMVPPVFWVQSGLLHYYI